MRIKVIILASMSLWILISQPYIFARDILWQDISRENLNLRTVLVNPDDPRIIYIGSNNAILKTEDGGESWRNILSIRGKNRVVNILLFDQQDKDSLYAATGEGLFYSHNQGKSWKRIFQGKDYLERECTALAILPSSIYLGTRAGLFVSKDKGRSWYKARGQLSSSHILAITVHPKEPDCIYVACVDGVFKSKDSGQSWERTFVTSPTENGNDAEEVTENQDEAERFSNIRYISIDPNNLDRLYLATSSGIYKSQDRGLSWELLSSYGLLSSDARFLLVSAESYLYAVTKSGVFEYKNGRWQELSLRLPVQEIRFLAEDNQGNLYAASDMGLFKTNREYFEDGNKDNPLDLYYKDEPAIAEVQQAAIKYAEVEPEKIKRWRRQAARRALLPKITIGMDQDNNRTVSKSIWGIYESSSLPGRHYIGPDDETKYDNKNWNISLTWELGDLIYNDDQTSIDVRSKLMDKLRPVVSIL